MWQQFQAKNVLYVQTQKRIPSLNLLKAGPLSEAREKQCYSK